MGSDPRFKCTPSTSWDGSFMKYAGNNGFCNCGFGRGCAYVCAGGINSSPSACAPATCSTGMYKFDRKNTWIIDVTKSGGPHRAFAYVPFGANKWSGPVKFSFTFSTSNFKPQSVYSKLFFWGDGNNILGLLPPGHQMGKGKMQMIFIPSNDYPNSWKAAMPIADDTWYRVEMTFKPPTTIDLSVNGKVISTGGKIPQSFASNHNGPQIGVYLWGQLKGKYQVKIRDVCLGSSSPAR